MRDFAIYLNGRLVTVVGIARHPASQARETARRLAEQFRTTPQDTIFIKS